MAISQTATVSSPAEPSYSPRGEPEVQEGGSSATSAMAPLEAETTGEADTALPTASGPLKNALLAPLPNTNESLGNAAAAGHAEATPLAPAAKDPKSKPGSQAVGVWVVHPGDQRLEWPANPSKRQLGRGGTAVVFRSVSVTFG